MSNTVSMTSTSMLMLVLVLDSLSLSSSALNRMEMSCYTSEAGYFSRTWFQKDISSLNVKIELVWVRSSLPSFSAIFRELPSYLMVVSIASWPLERFSSNWFS